MTTDTNEQTWKKNPTLVGTRASLFAFLILFLGVCMYDVLFTMICVMCERR